MASPRAESRLFPRVERALESLRPQIADYLAGGPVEVAVILGTGLGGLSKALEEAVRVPYARIDELPRARAPGHAGELRLGAMLGRRVAVLDGRAHAYEGFSARDLALPVYLVRQLGARTLVITNAAGALNPDFQPGDLMLIEDHINLLGDNPLIGPEEPELGPRFPDMSRAYALELREHAQRAAAEAGIDLRSGIYVAVRGPSFETSAERRAFRALGADAIGMSTVPEVIAANHCGLEVLGLSAITNVATGAEDQPPDDPDQVLHHAGIAGARAEKLLRHLLPRL